MQSIPFIFLNFDDINSICCSSLGLFFNFCRYIPMKDSTWSKPQKTLMFYLSQDQVQRQLTRESEVCADISNNNRLERVKPSVMKSAEIMSRLKLTKSWHSCYRNRKKVVPTTSKVSLFASLTWRNCWKGFHCCRSGTKSACFHQRLRRFDGTFRDVAHTGLVVKPQE